MSDNNIVEANLEVDTVTVLVVIDLFWRHESPFNL